MKFTEKLERLEQAGFPIRYADRGEWRPTGPYGWNASRSYATAPGTWDMSERVPSYVSHRSVHNLPEENTRAFVDLGDIARGDDRTGQNSTVDRSNYRSLLEAYPDTFTPISYPDTDTLGAFVGNLPDEVVEVVAGLKCDYSLFNEEDMSALESDEIQESYGQWARSDVAGTLDDESRDLWDALDFVKLPAEVTPDGVETPERWAQEDLFWDAYSRNEGNDYATHTGTEVSWDFDAMAGALAERLDEHFSADPTAEVAGQDTLPGLDREAGE